MTRRRVVVGTAAGAALVLLAGRWAAALYTDYLWYASLGAADVWRTRFWVGALLVVSSFAVAALFALANFYAVRQSVVSLVLPRRIANVEIGEEVPGEQLFVAAVVLAIIAGVGLVLSPDHWVDALGAFTGLPFGESDPYVGADFGFFVYWLPFEVILHQWAIVVLVVVTVMVVGLYALTPSLRWDRGRPYLSAYVQRHLTVLGSVLLALLGWGYRLSMYRVLTSGGGSAGVFTSADQRLIPALLLLAVVTFCAAIVVLWAGWSGQLRLALLAVSAVVLFSVAARWVAPLLARRSLDPTDVAAQERPFVATRLSYTRRAFGVDRMRPDSLGAGFASARDAALRVAVWDGATLARAAERLRRVRVVGDGAGWQANGASLAALLVEHSSEGGADTRDVWGIGRYDPTAADERGLPVRVASARLAEETLIEEPAVYDSAPAYSVLSDSLRQMAGVEMVSTRSRLAHAWALQNFRLLFGDLPLDRPTMVRRRDVRTRVSALAPFLVQGSEVTPVYAADSLYWALELYAASGLYPLSQRFTILGEERGYLQHAATALVHAASGRVRMVSAASPDPVAATWIARFPRLFVRATSLSAPLQAALPPVTDGARAQALAFAAAGFRGDSLEVRHFAALDGADSSSAREPVHLALPEGGVADAWPLLDESDRVRGLVAAPSGAQRVTTWIPVASDGMRWGSVLDRLRAADTSSRESGVVRAPLRAVPVGMHALYLQSVFQWRPGGSPRLLHVEALANDSLRVGPTLLAAIDASARTGAGSTPLRDLRGRADSLYRAMRDALARGDWASFGRAFDALGAALRTP